MSGLPGVWATSTRTVPQGRDPNMAAIKAGVVSGVDVSSPSPIDVNPGGNTFAADDGGTWHFIIIGLCFLILFVVL